MNKPLKSIPAMVVGIIGGILGLIGSVIPLACASALKDVGADFEGEYLAIIMIIICCFLLPAIIDVVGSALCVKFARIGALLCGVATVVTVIGLILYGISIMIIIALILYAVATILGFVGNKPVENVTPENK